MDAESLRRFVVDAHRNGYATGGAEREGRLDDKSIEYREGDWRYVDRYHGSRSFVGREVVCHRGTPAWAMSYAGSLTVESVDAATVYDFLREALANASTDRPFRGPDRDGDRFRYRCEPTGSFDRFSGTERIATADETVYRGQFTGGRID